MSTPATSTGATSPEGSEPAVADPGLGGRYHRLFAAGTISNLGDGVFAVALPLVAAALTRNPTAVAAVTLAQRLPWLVFALVAGALVDRWDRRRTMVAADAVRTVLLVLFTVAVAADAETLPMLYALAFVLGIAETLFDNAAQTIVPSLVRPDQLERANGRLFTSETVTNLFIGPPLGGLLVATAAWAAFALDAATFAVATVLVASITGTYRATGRADAGTKRPALRTEIAEGLRWLWRHRLIRTLGLLLALLNFSFTATMAIAVLYATDTLGVGEVGFGLLTAAAAVGSVVGGVGAGRLVERYGRGPLLVGSGIVFGAGLAAQGLVSDPWSYGGLAVVLGFATVVWNVLTVSLRQALIPDDLLGRVNSVYRFLGWGSMPLGALAGGIVADITNLRVPFLGGGVAILVGVAVTAPVLMSAPGTSGGVETPPTD